MLCLVSLIILEDEIYKTKKQDCEHNIAFWNFSDGLKSRIRHASIDWALLTTINCTHLG